MAQRKSPAGGERFAGVIRDARREKGLNQQSLADALGLSRNTVAGWETGHSRPDLDSVPALCRELGLSLNGFFGVRETVTRGERQLLSSFRSLEPEDQRALLWQVEALAAGRRAQRAAQAAAPAKRSAPPRGKVVSLFRNDLSAAAGVGVPLDAPRGTEVFLRLDGVTSRADEIITVNGHSMEPTFQDGDEVLVEHTESLREGEIGVFLADGEGYIKEYRKDGLYSHHPAYPPLRFSEGNEVRCVGRVLGKVQAAQRLTEEEQRWMEESK